MVTLAVFLWALASPVRDQTHAVTMSFMTLVLAQIFHLANARRQTAVLDTASIFSNRWAVGAVILTLGLQLLAVYWAPLAGVLDLRRLEVADWLIIVPLAFLPAIAGQAAKLVRKRIRG